MGDSKKLQVGGLAAGQRIIMVDGVAYAAGVGGMHAAVIGGRRIGDVFSRLSSKAEDGTMLLNGQTITECDQFLPEFWQWLDEGVGELTEVPVYTEWVQPKLTANGDPSIDEYAVKFDNTDVDAKGNAGKEYSANYATYKSFDKTLGGSNSYASYKTTKKVDITFCSQHMLKLSAISLQMPSAGSNANRIKRLVISVSNDGEGFNQVREVTLDDANRKHKAVLEIPIDEELYSLDTPGYRLWRFHVENNGGTTTTDFPEITMVGERFKYITYTSGADSTIRAITEEHYNEELETMGLCGAFVIDREHKMVRLPRLIGCVLWGVETGDIGKTLPAGLPELSIPMYNESGKINDHIGSGGTAAETVVFNASTVNEFFGRSDTVRPPAGCVCNFIQVSHAAVNIGSMDVSKISNQLQNKVDLSFTNADSALDFVIERYTSEDGIGGYELWRSGYIKQYGRCTVGVKRELIKFYKKFRDDKYSIAFAETYTGTDSEGVNYSACADSLTAESMYVSHAANRFSCWTVSGYVALD